MLWLTDLHLDRASPLAQKGLEQAIQQSRASPVLITGDISNATRLIADLTRLAEVAQRPIYFVLGNHDHFGGSVGTIRDGVLELAEREPMIQWLPHFGLALLDDDSALIGVDGWADGRVGEPLKTPLVLNDDRLIAEIAAQTSRLAKLQVKRVLADADAARLGVLLQRAHESGRREIFIATHVPPFAAAIRPGSRQDHPDWLPLLVCGATGEVIRTFAAEHPDAQFTVLCGHTHHAYETEFTANLRVRVGRPREAG